MILNQESFRNASIQEQYPSCNLPAPRNVPSLKTLCRQKFTQEEVKNANEIVLEILTNLDSEYSSSLVYRRLSNPQDQAAFLQKTLDRCFPVRDLDLIHIDLYQHQPFQIDLSEEKYLLFQISEHDSSQEAVHFDPTYLPMHFYLCTKKSENSIPTEESEERILIDLKKATRGNLPTKLSCLSNGETLNSDYQVENPEPLSDKHRDFTSDSELAKVYLSLKDRVY